MTEKELEKLFREKLASKEVPFSPAAWDKMEQLLDKEMPVTKGWELASWNSYLGTAAGIAATALLLFAVNSDAVDPIENLPLDLPANSITHQSKGATPENAFVVDENNLSSLADDGINANHQNTPALDGDDANLAAIGRQRRTENRPPSSRENENNLQHISDIGSDDLNGIVDLHPLAFGTIVNSPHTSKNLEIAEMAQKATALPNVIDNTSIYALGGMMRASDWSGKNRDFVQSGYTLGLGLRYRFSQRWSVETGFNYTQVSDVNSSFVYSVESFDFGRTVTTYHVHGHQSSFVEIPVSMVHTVGRHSFHTGAQFSLLANKRNTVTEVRENFWSQNTQKYTQNGQMSAYRNYDLGITLAYEYSLTPALSFKMLGVYGLVDQTINSYFGQDFFARNTSLRLMLAYQLY